MVDPGRTVRARTMKKTKHRTRPVNSATHPDQKCNGYSYTMNRTMRRSEISTLSIQQKPQPTSHTSKIAKKNGQFTTIRVSIGQAQRTKESFLDLGSLSV